jgi:hypothetical protein
MCVQFYATKLVVTTGAAQGKGHDGELYVNPDCAIGTILAYDSDDHLYVYVGATGRGAIVDEQTKPSAWPRATHKGVQLYRDYWKHVASGANTPYGAAMRNAPHRVLREAKR